MQLRSDQIRSDQIRSDQIRSDQIRSDQIRSDLIRSPTDEQNTWTNPYTNVTSDTMDIRQKQEKKGSSISSRLGDCQSTLLPLN